MSLERFEILLPLRYNDGTPVEPEKFQQTRIELIKIRNIFSVFLCASVSLWLKFRF